MTILLLLFTSADPAGELTRVKKTEGWISGVPPSAGGEVEGSGSVSDVSFPNEEQGVDADPNQQLHLPEPILWRDRVHHLHQH